MLSIDLVYTQHMLSIYSIFKGLPLELRGVGPRTCAYAEHILSIYTISRGLSLEFRGISPGTFGRGL